MEENFKLEKCGDDDALEFDAGIYKVETVIEKVRGLFKDKIGQMICDSLKSQQINIHPGGSSDKNFIYFWNWFDRGIQCKILRVGAKGWQKGKIRLKLLSNSTQTNQKRILIRIHPSTIFAK